MENNQETFLTRWAKKSQSRRDREFYLLALPITVAVVGLAPHLLQLLFVPGHGGSVANLSILVVTGAAIVGVVTYGLTLWLSGPKVWGPVRNRWPVFTHLLVLWTPVTLLVDGPQRMAELMMIAYPGFSTAHVAPYALGVAAARTFLFSGGVVFFERLIGAVNEADQQRRRAVWLETEVMKSLIQPHFLFNSLNTIRAYLEEAPKVAEEMLIDLSSLLRRVVRLSSLNEVSLDEEIKAVEEYVAIMNRRFEADFKLVVNNIPDSNFTIPPLILFTLVENSFTHGFSGRNEGTVTIDIKPDDRLRITVTDDGISGEVDGKSAGGAGWQYVLARLELSYGSDFEFTHQPNKIGAGFQAVMEIPWPKG